MIPTDLLCISPFDLLADTVLLASPLAKPIATSSKYSIVRASGAFIPGPVNIKKEVLRKRSRSYR